jgi:hypothetical protein
LQGKNEKIFNNFGASPHEAPGGKKRRSAAKKCHSKGDKTQTIDYKIYTARV